MDLYLELQQKINELQASIKYLRKSGSEFAEAEKNYKITLRTEVLRMKEEGMAVTLINLVIYGVPAVAEARFKRDIAETVYKANQESIQATKLMIRILQNQIAREYGETLND